MPHSNDYAKRLLRELPKDPESLLRSKSYTRPAFLTLFFEWLDDQIFHDPQAGRRWAQIAPNLALKASEGDSPEGRREHRSRLVQAWAILGSAHRASGDPDAAARAYREACKLLDSEPITEVVRGDTDRRLSTLRACQGRPEEALRLASRAVATLRKIDGAPLAAALVSLGYVLAAELGRYQEAVNAFGEALTLSANGSSPAEQRVHATAAKNLALALSDSKSLADQKTALLFLRNCHQLLKGRVRCPERYRLFWVEAIIWARLGSHGKATRLLRRALAGFEHLRLPWEIALVGLDLAAILHLCGELDEMAEVAVVTFHRFRVLSGADRQTLAALSLWSDAVQARSWTVADQEDPGRPLRRYEQLHAAARQVILAGIARGGCCQAPRRS